jgi:hypothetical protein
LDSRATLACLLLSYGIPVCVEPEVVRKINELTRGIVPTVLDASVDLELEYEENVLYTDLTDLVAFDPELLSSLLDVIIVVDEEAFTEELPEVLHVLVVSSSPGRVRSNPSVPLLSLGRRCAFYLGRGNRLSISYSELRYLEDVAGWVNARDVLSEEYAYRHDDTLLRLALDLVEDRLNLSVSDISRSLSVPSHWARILIFLIEKSEERVVRHRVWDWMEPVDKTLFSVKESVDESFVMTVTDELGVRFQAWAYSLYQELSSGYLTWKELCRRTGLGRGELVKVLSLLSRFNALTYKFRYTPPSI